MAPRTGLDFEREKYLAPGKIHTLVHLAHGLVSTPYMLLQQP